jgi:RNA polymerase primary sigma factor
MYLREIRRYPLLPRAEEVALARRIHRGDVEALSSLVCSNLRFVVAVAKRFQDRGVPIEDLIDEGNLGLIRAAEKFDEARGVKFITYAVWWIRQAILQALMVQGHIVRLPLDRAGVLRRIKQRTNALRHELTRDPTQREVANRARVSEETVLATRSLARSCVSLDGSLPSSEGGTMFEYIPDDLTPPTDDSATGSALATSVQRALAFLSPRQAKVLSLYFGLDGGDPMTLRAIAQSLGVTRERARQIKEKALWRLRNSDHARTLEAFRAS